MKFPGEAGKKGTLKTLARIGEAARELLERV
jgi:hypothetical protein